MDVLSDQEKDLLASVAAGGTLAGYSRDHDYSVAWGKWKGREIRRKLGVATLEEAIRVSQGEPEPGVSRADFDRLSGLVEKLGDSLEELAQARPAEQPAARAEVRERELSLKDHAKALGLSLADVELLKEERDYERFRAMQERLEAERAEEAAEAAASGGNDEGKGAGQRILDGLGGIRNVKP